jgi:hypothetical protein
MEQLPWHCLAEHCTYRSLQALAAANRALSSVLRPRIQLLARREIPEFVDWRGNRVHVVLQKNDAVHARCFDTFFSLSNAISPPYTFFFRINHHAQATISTHPSQIIVAMSVGYGHMISHYRLANHQLAPLTRAATLELFALLAQAARRLIYRV